MHPVAATSARAVIAPSATGRTVVLEVANEGGKV